MLQTPGHKPVILYISANPGTTKFVRYETQFSTNQNEYAPLAVDVEARELQEMMTTQFKDRIEFQHWPAVQLETLQQLLNTSQPSILHFSCHGEKSGQLILLDRNNAEKGIGPDLFRDILRNAPSDLQLVVLNACYSNQHAEAIQDIVGCVVGTGRSVPDEAALHFSVGFYHAICSRLDVNKAFEQGKTHIKTNEAFGWDAFHLFPADSKLILVPEQIQPACKPNNLPYSSLGSLFKGRDDAIDKLRDQLTSSHAAAVTAKQAIHGLGGVGKTRLAIEYALEFEREYTALFFVQADSPETLQRELAKLAAFLDLPEKTAAEESVQAEAVLRCLETYGGWLLIIDNADSEKAAVAVEQRLPRLNQGHVLITSRLSNWSGSIQCLELDVLSEQAAAEFLLERTNARRQKKPTDEADALQLARDVDGLALALEQAGAYIAKMRLSIAEYLKRWQNNERKLRTWSDERLMQYPRSLAVTWHTTFEQLDAPARALLRLLAWLAPEPIPWEMFETEKGAKLFAKAVAGPDGDEDPPEASLEDAKEGLLSYSLLKWDEEKEGWRVHRLVQEITREDIPREEQQFWFDIAFEIVGNLTKDELQGPHKWLPSLLPHVHVVLAQDSVDHFSRQGRLMVNTAKYLHRAQFSLDKAKRYYEEGIKKLWRTDISKIPVDISAIPPESRAEAATDFRNAGDLYKNARDPFKASQYYEYASSLLENMERRKGERGRLLSSLADLYSRYEKRPEDFDRATRYAKDSLAIQIEVKDKYEIAVSLRILADVYLSQGDLNAAEREMKNAEEAIQQAESELTEKNEEIQKQRGWLWRSRGILAQLQGQTNEAIQWFERAVTLFESAAASVGTAISYQKLGLAYLQSNDGNQAQKYFQLADKAGEQIRGGAEDLRAEVSACLSIANYYLCKISECEGPKSTHETFTARPRPIPFGVASSLSKSIDSYGRPRFDPIDSLSYTTETKFRVLQLYLDTETIEESERREKLRGKAERDNVNLICHAPSVLTDSDDKVIEVAMDLIPCEEKLVVFHFDEHEEISNHVLAVKQLCDKGIVPCIENFHIGSEPIPAKDYYDKFFGMFKQLNGNFPAIAVIDVPRIFDEKLKLNLDEATKQTIDVFERLSSMQIPTILHLINSSSSKMSDRSKWCPLGNRGFIPYSELLKAIMRVRVKAIIMEYEDKANPLLSLPFLEAAFGT